MEIRVRNLVVRLAGLTALGAAVLLGLVVLGVVVDNPDEVFVAFLFLLVVVCSAWIALTRRGAIRLVALTALLLGLALLVLQVGLYGAEQLILLVALVALYGFAGRFATRGEPPREHAPRRCVGRAARGVLLINPKSGGGKASRFFLIDEARMRGLEPVVLRPGDDLRKLATQAIAKGADVVGMAGGDGSQAIVASIAMEHEAAHVCVPAGTRNHFAVDLGLDRDDVLGALDAFTDGVEKRIDLAQVNGHVFVNNASLGLYAHVVQSDCYRNAKLATWRGMLPDLLGPKAARIDLRFEDADRAPWDDAAIVLVSNNPYEVKRFAGAGTRHSLDTGRLGIVAARVGGTASVARLVTLATLLQSKRFKGLREWAALEFEVHSDSPVAVGLDGERFVLEPPLRFTSLPGALRVRLPRHAPGMSPAEAGFPLTGRNLARLVRVVAGTST
jgi:diacylglycerol kinase family enzyme